MARLKSLDVFRGLTVATMVLVDCSPELFAYPWLLHAPWNGCRLADLVFPAFIFIVGVSLVFALHQSQQRGLSNKQLILKITKRSLILFALGVLLNAFPYFSFDTLRYFGVLQRIALCYWAGALFFLTMDACVQRIVFISILLGYAWLLTHTGGHFDLSPAHNVVTWMDHWLVNASHLYHAPTDPEGVLSTVAAFATALLGNLTGITLMSRQSMQKKCQSMLLIAFLLLSVGAWWSVTLPINKSLWTSSFVMWSGGIVLGVFTLIYFIIEIKAKDAYTWPFAVLGRHALFVFIGHVIVLKLLYALPTHVNGVRVSVQTYLIRGLAQEFTPQQAALMYAVGSVMGWIALMMVWEHVRRRKGSSNLKYTNA